MSNTRQMPRHVNRWRQVTTAQPCRICGLTFSCLVHKVRMRTGAVAATALCTRKNSGRPVYDDDDKLLGHLHPLPYKRKRGAR